MSYTQNNNNDKEEYTYTYIRIRGLNNNSSTSKRRRTKLTLYIPLEYEVLVDKLEEIVRREGKSISRLFLDWAERYVRLHSPGNPQQTLDTIIKEEKPYRAPAQCEVCGALATYKALLLDKQYHLLCEKHFRMQVRQNHVLGWKKVERKNLAP